MASKRQKGRPEPVAPAAAAKPRVLLLPWLERHALWIAVVLVLLGSVRIAATYTVFSHTSDEPNHIACGMEWLDKGSYTYETQHPPLARVAAALGPFLSGLRSQGPVTPDSISVTKEGNAILYRGSYDRTLALARLGILPFFWIACAAVFWWCRREWGPASAAIAVLLFSFLPPVLAHAGLATTDMALAAFVGASFAGAFWWLENPTPRRAAIWGVCLGLAAGSKLTGPMFLAAAFAVALAWNLARERRLTMPPVSLAITLLAAVVVIAFLYRFHFEALASGFRTVFRHNQEGHPTYLLGERNRTGFWSYYPIALAVKTPLPFLMLAIAGLVMAWKRLWIPLSLSLGILAVAMPSHIDIGIRHILPVYFGLSIAAAVAVTRFAASPGPKMWIAGLLLLWYMGSSLIAHPDYLPYFNELAGSQPEKILADSNLDWGQDMKRLAARLRDGGARQLTFNQYFLADLERQHGFPPIREMDMLNPSPGWNAVSLTYLKVARLGLWYSYPEVVPWPERVPPTERVGKSILLWYFPER